MSTHSWADRSEHEKRCAGCHVIAVRIFRPGADGYDIQYFTPDGTQTGAPPECAGPAAARTSQPLPPAPFYVFARLAAPLAETQAAALSRELAACGVRSHVNTEPAFVSLRLDADSMPGAEASARPVLDEAFTRAGLTELPSQLIAIPEGQAAPQPATTPQTARPAVQPLLLEAG